MSQNVSGSCSIWTAVAETIVALVEGYCAHAGNGAGCTSRLHIGGSRRWRRGFEAADDFDRRNEWQRIVADDGRDCREREIEKGEKERESVSTRRNYDARR